MTTHTDDGVTGEALEVRIGTNVGSILVLIVNAFSFLVFLLLLVVGVVSLVDPASQDGGAQPGLAIFGLLGTLGLGWLLWNFASRMLRRTPAARFDENGAWVRTRKQYEWRWEEIRVMYLWQKRTGSSTIRYLSLEPFPSPKADEMCARMKAPRFNGLGVPVPQAARALTVNFTAGIRPKRDDVVAYIRRVAPNVEVYTNS